MFAIKIRSNLLDVFHSKYYYRNDILAFVAVPRQLCILCRTMVSSTYSSFCPPTVNLRKCCCLKCPSASHLSFLCSLEDLHTLRLTGSMHRDAVNHKESFNVNTTSVYRPLTIHNINRALLVYSFTENSHTVMTMAMYVLIIQIK